jgi:KaiC/GvpD/RAD55 family RecA-like ATPase
MTMLIGATGIGKTQLGIHFCQAGADSEGARGAVIDLSSRGDSQNHAGYSQRMFDRSLSTHDSTTYDSTTYDSSIQGKIFAETTPREDMTAAAMPSAASEQAIFGTERPADLMSFLGYGGRRVMRSQLDVDQWHAWQSEMNRRTPQLFHFVYQHLVHGTRRFLIDGIEPPGSAADSLQLDLLELIYHRMLRQEHDWLAREVLRQDYRKFESQVAEHAYDHRAAAAVVLVTTKQSMLEALLNEPLADGDLAAGANTVILLGRQMVDGKMRRGLMIAKHRGSYADSSIIHFDINNQGIVLEP